MMVPFDEISSPVPPKATYTDAFCDGVVGGLRKAKACWQRVCEGFKAFSFLFSCFSKAPREEEWSEMGVLAKRRFKIVDAMNCALVREDAAELDSLFEDLEKVDGEIRGEKQKRARRMDNSFFLGQLNVSAEVVEL